MAYISYQPSDYFNTKIYTGTGAENVVSDIGFNPDWVWFKKRSATEHHFVYDQVRGALKKLAPSNSNAESTETQTLKSFGSGGYTLGTSAEVNGSGVTYVSWHWKANGAGSANSDGNASNVTVSADTTRGFSIVKFDVSTSIKTIGHGLGVAPEVIVMKQINGTTGWIVGNTYTGWNKYLMFQSGNAASTETRMFYPNSNNPTSSVWETEGSAWLTPSSGTAIAYCFAPKKGFSKFGSYIGNGSVNGTFIYTGFKPAFVMAKKTSGSGDWIIWDNKRDGFNETIKRVYPNSTAAEESSTTQGVDFLCNGFKLRGTSSNAWNSGNDTYFYMSFAEEPLVSSNNIPATAR